jgi:cation/acetate symporter
MDLQTLTYLVVGATFALYIGIAFWARASSTSEFYVAGKGVHPVANGMATAADWMSAASFISMAGLIAFNGYGASAYLMGWTGGYVLLALLLAPYLRKFGKFTVPEFIGDRYYSQTARLVAVICLIVASITYVIGQMKGVGVVFSRFIDLSSITEMIGLVNSDGSLQNDKTGVLVGMGIVFIYAVLGGMKGVTYTQIAQYVVLIFAYTIPAIFISLNLTDNALPQIGLAASLSDGTGMLDKLDTIVTDLGFNAYTAASGSTLNMFMLTMSLMIGTAGLPHVIIRFFTVPKVADARKSAGWALVFIAILYTTAPSVGSMARLNLMQTIQTGPVGDATANLVYEERPQWFKNWEKTGLLKFEDKNGDGRIQYYNDKNAEFAKKAESFGWKGNEMVKVDRDIMVLANPEIAKLPDWVIALVIAGGLAAALSTAAGLLLAISSAISHDLLKGMFAKNISEKGELLAGRIAMAGAIVVAGLLGMNPPGFAAQVVALAFGLAASSIFPALMMGIFNKKMNMPGAVLGMISGLMFTLIYIFWFKGWFFIPGTEMAKNVAANWLWGIQPESIGALGAVVNFVVAYVVSKVTTPPPEHIQHLVEDVRVPKGAGTATGH